MIRATDLLTDLSVDELEAPAGSLLLPSAQTLLDDLLERNRDRTLTKDELVDLDRLRQQVDQLTLLKTRARYTLTQWRAEAPAT